jgi:hypothetical protein
MPRNLAIRLDASAALQFGGQETEVASGHVVTVAPGVGQRPQFGMSVRSGRTDLSRAERLASSIRPAGPPPMDRGGSPPPRRSGMPPGKPSQPQRLHATSGRLVSGQRRRGPGGVGLAGHALPLLVVRFVVRDGGNRWGSWGVVRRSALLLVLVEAV